MSTSTTLLFSMRIFAFAGPKFRQPVNLLRSFFANVLVVSAGVERRFAGVALSVDPALGISIGFPPLGQKVVRIPLPLSAEARIPHAEQVNHES